MAVSKSKHETEILDGSDDTAEMQEQLESSTRAMQQLQDALTQERETSAGLREQLAHGNDDAGSAREGRGLRWFFAEIWSYPQFRMLAVSLVVAAWLAASKNLGAGNVAFGVVAALLFCKWAEAVYRKLGPGQLVLKCLAAIFGLAGMCAAFFGESEPGAAFAAALAVLTFTALLVMSKATERLAESGMAVARFVREWF
jgi:hypothetical protein